MAPKGTVIAARSRPTAGTWGSQAMFVSSSASRLRQHSAIVAPICTTTRRWSTLARSPADRPDASESRRSSSFFASLDVSFGLRASKKWSSSLSSSPRSTVTNDESA